MHRQSLGSKRSKYDAVPSSLSPSRFPPRRFSISPPLSSPSPKTYKLIIHFIPILNLLCFLLLFLLSHTPSQSDLAQFKRFKRPPPIPTDSKKIDDVSGLAELRSGEVSAIQSPFLRNLRGIINNNIPNDRAALKYSFHRKFAHF